MEEVIVYHCTGSCGGSTFEKKNCGGEACNLHGHPLKAFKECASCAAKTAEDSQPHYCADCEPIESHIL